MLAALSVEWFRALQRQMNAAPEKYRRIGASDVRVLVRVVGGNGPTADRAAGLVFRDYGCAEVCEVTEPRFFDPDFIIEGPYDVWIEMVENICEHGGADTRQALSPIGELSQRELQVITLMRMGASTAAIADQLYISKATVRNHIQNILSKLKVHTRLEAVAYVNRIAADGHEPHRERSDGDGAAQARGLAGGEEPQSTRSQVGPLTRRR
jgi:DNA-binding CsgD family transcriptional regulator